jgi:hypothetical protein
MGGEDNLKQGKDKLEDDDGEATQANTPEPNEPQEVKAVVLAKSAVVAIMSAKNHVDKLERNLDALDGAGTQNWKLFVNELRELSMNCALSGNLKSAHTAIEALLFLHDKEEAAAEDDAEAL